MGNTVRVVSKTRNIDENLGKILNEQRKLGKYCDYILKAENGDEFPVHKVVLESVSDFFNKLFNTEFADSKKDYFIVRNCTVVVLKKIIEFMYTNEIELSASTVKEITDIALFLVLSNLVDICFEYLIDNININNCFDLLSYSESIYCGDNLRKKCIEKIFNNFATLIHTNMKDFKEMTLDSIHMLVKYDDTKLNDKKNDLKIVDKINTLKKERKEKEIDKYLCIIIINWINYDLWTREKYLTTLFEYINFNNIDFEYRLTKFRYQKDNPLRNNGTFLSQMFNVLMQKWEEDKRNELKSGNQQSTSNRNNHSSTPINTNNVNLYGIFGNQVIAYNTETNHFDKVLTKILHKPKNFAYTVVEDKKLLICGGRNSIGLSNNECLCYSTSANYWAQLSNMNRSRSGHRATVLKNNIYVTGGLNDRSVEVLDIHSTTWRRMPFALEKPMRTVGLCTLNDCIYAINYKDFQYWDTRMSNWSLINTDNHRSYLKNVFDYKLRAIGYCNFIHRFDYTGIDTFDIRMNRWLDRKTFPNDDSYFHQFEVCVLKDKIYMLTTSRNWKMFNYEFVLHSFNAANLRMHDYRYVTSEVNDYNWGFFAM